MSESINDLAESYLEVADEEISREKRNSLVERIEELEDERGKYVSDYGEEDPLVEDLDEELKEAREELTSIENLQDRQTASRNEFLASIANGFIAKGEDTSRPVLRAINRALIGAESDEVLIFDHTLSPDSEITDDIRLVSDAIRKLALAELGDDDSIKESWASIEGTTKEGAFYEVASSVGPVEPSSIADSLGEEVDGSTASARLRNTVHQVDYHPYHRIEGQYTLSIIGEYMNQQFTDEVVEKLDEELPSDESEKQQTLTGDTS